MGKALLRGNRQARWVALARLLGGLLLAIGGGAVYAAQILLVTFSMGALLIGEPGAARLLAGKIAYVLVLGAVLIGAFWPLG